MYLPLERYVPLTQLSIHNVPSLQKGFFFFWEGMGELGRCWSHIKRRKEVPRYAPGCVISDWRSSGRLRLNLSQVSFSPDTYGLLFVNFRPHPAHPPSSFSKKRTKVMSPRPFLYPRPATICCSCCFSFLLLLMFLLLLLPLLFWDLLFLLLLLFMLV